MTMREAIEIGLVASRAAKRTGSHFRFDGRRMGALGFTNDQVRKAQMHVDRIEKFIADELAATDGERATEHDRGSSAT